MKLLTTKYAAELNALDLGEHHMISWLKNYKYRGEMRQKVHKFERVDRIVHQKTGVEIWYKEEERQYWFSDKELPFDAQVAVFDLSQDEDAE